MGAGHNALGNSAAKNCYASYQYMVFKVTEVKLDISFCTKDEIKELNKKFRNKEAPTNVLSFPDIARIFNV